MEPLETSAVKRRAPYPDTTGLWPRVLLGIALAGALFGFFLVLIILVGEDLEVSSIVVAVIGGVVGFLYAGFVAIPVVLLLATARWAIGTKQWHSLFAILAGGATGTLCGLSLSMADDVPFPLAATRFAVVPAALLGAAGAWIAAMKWAKTKRQMIHDVGEDVDDEAPVPNCCYRVGVFVLVTSIIVTACLGVVGMASHSREASRHRRCANTLKQIALCLQNYEMANHSLPPAYTTDQAGNPVLSWRVAAAKYCLYYLDFSESMDQGQPWNSPKNKEFLDHLADFCHCPSSGKEPDNPRTDYVAVVGPNTLWPGREPGDLKKHPKGILVVEWPKSDIHWAEPRDVTVEDFLDWFRRKPPRRGFLEWLFAWPAGHDTFHPNCLLYVDAQGNVGELPVNTDPETVRKLLVGQEISDVSQ